MKKKNIILLSILYIVYFAGLITKSDVIGDVLSPILTFSSFYYAYEFLYRKQTDSRNRIITLLIALSIFTWGICDTLWGISSLVLKVNPADNLIIEYGYTITNLFLFAAIVIYCFNEMKYWNKMQFFLDSVIIIICIISIMWLFVFNHKIENAMLLIDDIVSMIVLFMDIIIFAWLIISWFSIRSRTIPNYLKMVTIGLSLFVLTDFIYYYIFFYSIYEPNTLLDGLYIIAFTLVGISGILRESEKEYYKDKIKNYNETSKFGKELILITVPLLVLIFRRDSLQYLLFLVSSIMIYYVFTNYTQKNIFRDELLNKEKEYTKELEIMVDERTKEVIRLMKTDSITGLYSRRYFEEYLFNKCKKKQGERLLLFYVEMNKYKMIKSMYGKSMVETLLRLLGQRLKEEVLQSKKGKLASYGDDIFTLALSGDYTYEQAGDIADQMIHSCSDVYHINEHDIVVTLNIGITCFPLDSQTAEDLLKNADTAMIQARQNGFNKYLIFDQQLGQFVYNKSIIEIWLKKVKIDEEFKLVYQPQVLCKDGSLIGFEALVRWQTKSGQFISPIDFIPIAEETGIIISLGYWILEQAVNQLVCWQKNSTLDLRMAINVSAKQLNDKEFIPKLKSLLERKNVSPESIEIEITENIKLEQNGEIHSILEEINKLGISIAIDDFGTGYSSLYYLKNIPLQRIKIAKELIDNIDNDLYDNAITKAVISIGKIRGIKVLAEGVETIEQWECLKQLECDEIQGYYFAKPMDAQEIEQNWI